MEQYSMKVLLSVMLISTQLGCASNPPLSQSSAEVEAMAQATSSHSLSYLNKPLKGRVSQHGLYKLVRSGGIIDDPKTGTGKAVSKPVIQHLKSTARIPLIKSAQIYLQYRIWSLPDQPAYVDLRRVMKHPKMMLPDGSISTGSDYMIKGKVSANQVIGYTGYGLDEDYELVEGDWVFQIWYKDKMLVEQKFTTYYPDKEEHAILESLLVPGKKVNNKKQSL
jgi:hypothetical protein